MLNNTTDNDFFQIKVKDTQTQQIFIYIYKFKDIVKIDAMFNSKTAETEEGCITMNNGEHITINSKDLKILVEKLNVHKIDGYVKVEKN